MALADLPKGAGLIYYPDSEPGITRRRCGSGFRYVAADGTTLARGPERDRVVALAVPPAYRQVWITPHHNGHLQATGLDSEDRKQYRYHEDWTKHQSALKFERLGGLADSLPSLRRWIESRLRGEAGQFETALAATLALIDRASLRVGHSAYTASNGSYGATTILNEHVVVKDGHITLDFIAKGGLEVEKSFYAPRLAEVLEISQDLPGAQVLSGQDDYGTAYRIRSEHVNEKLADICGDAVTAKTLRTWNGTLAAFRAATAPGPLTIKSMSEAAAEVLHNTPTIARGSYIHPAVIALAEAEEDTRTALAEEPSRPQGLRTGEAALQRFLESA